MTLQFYVTGNPSYNGLVRLRFRWVPKLGLYLLDGKETEPKDFDRTFKEIFSNEIYRDMFPQVRITPGTLNDDGGEVTLDKALEVVESLAPHRLKKKTSPKVEDLEPAHA